MRDCGYETIVTEFDVPELKDAHFARTGEARTIDEDIIDWLGDRNGVWLHADDSAKIKHRKQILARKVRTLWVYRPSRKLSSRETIRILSYVLPDLLNRFEDQPKHEHYEVRTYGIHPQDNPRLKPYDLATFRMPVAPSARRPPR